VLFFWFYGEAPYMVPICEPPTSSAVTRSAGPVLLPLYDISPNLFKEKKKESWVWSRARVSSDQCKLWCFWKHFRKCFSDVTLHCLHFIMLLERGYLIPSSYMVIQFSICTIHKVLIDWPCFYGEYLLGSTDAGGDSEVLQTTPGP